MLSILKQLARPVGSITRAALTEREQREGGVSPDTDLDGRRSVQLMSLPIRISTMFRNVTWLFGVFIVTGLAVLCAVPAAHADPNYGSTGNGDDMAYGQFNIINNTGVPITYWVKWGTNGSWQQHTVQTGYHDKHSHPLNNAGTVPPPYILFRAGQGRILYLLTCNSVGQAGGQPKNYGFGYGSNRSLDLFVWNGSI
jgi:hypothetical protein